MAASCRAFYFFGGSHRWFGGKLHLHPKALVLDAGQTLRRDVFLRTMSSYAGSAVINRTRLSRATTISKTNGADMPTSGELRVAPRLGGAGWNAWIGHAGSIGSTVCTEIIAAGRSSIITTQGSSTRSLAKHFPQRNHHPTRSAPAYLLSCSPFFFFFRDHTSRQPFRTRYR